jgi:hypothetical protein
VDLFRIKHIRIPIPHPREKFINEFYKHFKFRALIKTKGICRILNKIALEALWWLIKWGLFWILVLFLFGVPILIF